MTFSGTVAKWNEYVPATTGPADGVKGATLFCTYPAEAAIAVFPRVTLARMSEARAVQMNGLGSML